MINYRDEIPGWCDFGHFYEQMVNKFSNGSVFVEVGCWLGQSAAIMAQSIRDSQKNIKFYTVDTFKGQSSYEPQMEVVRQNGGNIFYQFWENMQKYQLHHFIHPIISESYEGMNFIQEKEIDFVFIDANHEYEFVKRDIEHYWDKIKSGGILAGHDYFDIDGVKTAVNDFFGKRNIPIGIVDRSPSFVVVKP